jgi:signal transduction histidine kinase
VIIYGLLYRFFWRGCGSPWLGALAWMALVGVSVGAYWRMEIAARNEQRRLQSMVEGFAPTYASEMQRMEHAAITEKTSPEDPQYLKLIEAQIRWQKVNPAVNDLYTFRKRLDGKNILVIDSETDYDRNGRYEGDREQRSEIGIVYEPVIPALEEAFATGKPGFNATPITDRWGVWVSGYAPMFGPDGKVEAVQGIDFDANAWLAAAQRARRAVMVLALLMALIMAAGTTVAAIMLRRKVAESREAVEVVTEQGRTRFETLVNSIEGIVWEWDPQQFRYLFVSEQAAMLGHPLSAWTSVAGFWENHLHPEERNRLLEERRRLAQAGKPYHLEYRLRTAEGRDMWLRESGNVVLEASGQPSLMRGVLIDITDQRRSAENLETANRQLVEASRQAGMAEVATGVLHNVGNVLNSVNVSSELIHDRLRQSRLPGLSRLASLLRQQGARLADFLVHDERGRMVPSYLDQLSAHLHEEHEQLRRELGSLVRNVEHMKDIVMMQQAYAKLSGRTERLPLKDLIEDALHINSAAFSRHHIQVIRQFQTVPAVEVDRHKVLQILINLIRNAKHALDSTGRKEKQDRQLVLALTPHGAEMVRITVADNGMGIAPENLTRIFNHGFTTKKSGHGFGLHISALSAQEMGGRLHGSSPGPGQGASFTLDLPINVRPARPAENGPARLALEAHDTSAFAPVRVSALCSFSTESPTYAALDA